MKIDGVLVLYNPDNTQELVENINSYINNLDKLYVIDNSDVNKENLIENILSVFDKCVYFNNHGNKGLANALNTGAQLAIENSADWLLTMDQDSRFEDKSLFKMINYLERIGNVDKIGILSPYHFKINGRNTIKNKLVKEVTTTMTSGNLLNLKAYLKVGKFRDEYFIDYIDYEYCLRLKKNGFKILVLNESVLFHKLGNISKHKLLVFNIYCLNHEALRRYYKTRNRFNLIRNYIFDFPFFCLRDLCSFLKEILLIVFFEKDKSEKLKMIIKGIKDFLINRTGKTL